MARPKSEDKRNAILDAATRLFADRGLTAAPTSEISKQAGVAEGTLFTYFHTKDDLINALYREIKLELADAMMSDFPRKKNVRTRLRHVWDRYVNWGIANPKQRKALAQLQVSEVVTKESKLPSDGKPEVMPPGWQIAPDNALVLSGLATFRAAARSNSAPSSFLEL